MSIDLPLTLSPTKSIGPTNGVYPIRTGIPFPKGLLKNSENLALVDPVGNSLTRDLEPLALWPDGTWKWVELRFLAKVEGACTYRLTDLIAPSLAPRMQAVVKAGWISVNTGLIRISFSKTRPWPFEAVETKGVSLLNSHSPGLMDFQTINGKPCEYQNETFAVEYAGATTLTLAWSGKIISGPKVSCVLRSRVSVFANSSLVKAEFTLWNPKPAKHKGGLWDLGDRGSVLFRSFALPLSFNSGGTFSLGLDLASHEIHACGLEASLRQESSGNANWSSLVHVDRSGKSTPTFRGWTFQSEKTKLSGDQVNPVLLRTNAQQTIAMALENFRETFPNALRIQGDSAFIEPFPKPLSADGDFELQGGEKTHFTLWNDFDADQANPHLALLAARNPLAISLPPEWHTRSGAWGYLTPSFQNYDPFFENLTRGIVDGDQAFLNRREKFEELGWRNFGEVAADHELLHYHGKREFVSHYNNQYDLVHSLLTHYALSGDPRWFVLGRDLAKHVIHHDLYDTQGDKSAYNGGYFWHTAHYLHAGTATHRTYSRLAQESGIIPTGFGGGPSNEHNYGSGLLTWYYLTGDRDARHSVMQLAKWVRDMQDGNLTVFRFLSRNPTGLATATRDPAWQGPGRGAAFSINACLDAYALSGEKEWLDLAEGFIASCIHPEDNLQEMDLLNREERWSYVVFLQVLGKYLELKREAEATADKAFHLARASLLHYADWMEKNEYPYLDKPEQLEFPTSTWAAQELRKVNAFLWASRWAPPDEGQKYRNKAIAFFNKSRHYLEQASDATTVRNLALILAHIPLFQYATQNIQVWELQLPFQNEMFSPKQKIVPQKIQAKKNLNLMIKTLGVSGLLSLFRYWTKSTR